MSFPINMYKTQGVLSNALKLFTILYIFYVYVYKLVCHIEEMNDNSPELMALSVNNSKLVLFLFLNVFIV